MSLFLRSLAAAEVCLAVPVDGDALGDGARGPVGDLGDLAVDLDGPGADVLGADVVEGAVDLLALGPAVPAEVRREGVEVLALDDDVAVVVVERGRGVVGLVEGLGVVGDEGALARGRGNSRQMECQSMARAPWRRAAPAKRMDLARTMVVVGDDEML